MIKVKNTDLAQMLQAVNNLKSLVNLKPLANYKFRLKVPFNLVNNKKTKVVGSA